MTPEEQVRKEELDKDTVLTLREIEVIRTVMQRKIRRPGLDPYFVDCRLRDCDFSFGFAAKRLQEMIYKQFITYGQMNPLELAESANSLYKDVLADHRQALDRLEEEISKLPGGGA